MAPASCADMFAALKRDAAKNAPPKKRSRGDISIGDGLIFMTTSQKSLADICGITPDRCAVAFANMDAISDVLQPAKDSKERFMIRHEQNPITGTLVQVAHP